MDGRRVSQQQRRAFLEAAFLGQPICGARWNDDLLGEASEAGNGYDALADGPALNAFTDCLDLPGNLAARRERPGRLQLILVLDDEHVGKIDGRGTDADQKLARSRLRIGKLV